jgi:hypothetical protein
MSRQLPVPVRPGQTEPRADRPEVIVVDSRAAGSHGASGFGRLLVSLTPDLIRVVERSLAQRNEARPVAPATRVDTRAYRGGVQLSEVEYDTRLPFLRKVTVRKASAWTSDLPFVEPASEAPARRGRLRMAGFLSLGGAFALAALGLLAKRAGSIPGLGSRRGY